MHVAKVPGVQNIRINILCFLTDAGGCEDEGQDSPDEPTPRSPTSPTDDQAQRGDDDDRLDEAAGESKPINEDWDSGESNVYIRVPAYRVPCVSKC